MNDISSIRKVLSVAGSDPSGGAGIQADIKTISALGHYAMTAITAVTAQNTRGVSAVMPVSSEMLRSQLKAVYDDIPPDAVKTGMLMNRENVMVCAEIFSEYKARNIVCDTVIRSTSGRDLLDDDGVNAMIDRIFPLTDIITPNIPEAERLCGMTISDENDREKAVHILSGMTKGAVLLKGGHADRCADDMLYSEGKLSVLRAERIDNPNTHGTGCTLSSAIAVFLAEGRSLYDSVYLAKKYITAAIGAGLDIGSGNGPLWHFCDFS
ncbi:MAG: bifunctional hydroxymethylpyrimidine kinase/phosphomethylpyrimidine kinase [Huintestinicola sp.]